MWARIANHTTLACCTDCCLTERREPQLPAGLAEGRTVPAPPGPVRLPPAWARHALRTIAARLLAQHAEAAGSPSHAALGRHPPPAAASMPARAKVNMANGNGGQQGSAARLVRGAPRANCSAHVHPLHLHVGQAATVHDVPSRTLKGTPQWEKPPDCASVNRRWSCPSSAERRTRLGWISLN